MSPFFSYSTKFPTCLTYFLFCLNRLIIHLKLFDRLPLSRFPLPLSLVSSSMGLLPASYSLCYLLYSLFSGYPFLSHFYSFSFPPLSSLFFFYCLSFISRQCLHCFTSLTCQSFSSLSSRTFIVILQNIISLLYLTCLASLTSLPSVHFRSCVRYSPSPFLLIFLYILFTLYSHYLILLPLQSLLILSILLFVFQPLSSYLPSQCSFFSVSLLSYICFPHISLISVLSLLLLLSGSVVSTLTTLTVCQGNGV